MIRVGSDCSGVGAPELAIKQLGIPHRIVFASEKDKFARKSYKLLHPEVEQMFDDMTQRDPNSIEKNIDFYFAGIPCQTFSIAGNRKGESDPRGTLFYNAYDFIRVNRPRFFVIENVKGLLSDDKGRTFQKWLDMLAVTINGKYDMFKPTHPNFPCLGYHVQWKVINTVDHGIPQTRDRVFIVGMREASDSFEFPVGEVLRKCVRDLLEPIVDRKYFVSLKAIDFILREDRIAKRYTQVNGEVALTHTAKSQANWTGDFICIPEATKKGYAEARDGDVINLKFGDSKTRRGRVGKGISHTIEATAQLAVVVDPKIIVDGKLWDSQSGKVYNEDGIFPTIVAGGHGYNQGYVQPELNKIGDLYDGGGDAGRIYDVDQVARTLKAEGGGAGAKTGLYLVDQVNGSTESGGVQPYQHNRVYNSEGCVPALTAEGNGRNNILYADRIRRLTPKECFRLQGFPDWCVDLLTANGISDSQLYKQSGNSITEIVIRKIIKRLLKNIL